MNILIVYATFSNGTATASQTVAEELTHSNHNVTIKKIRDTSPEDFQHRDLIIMASPSWLVGGKEGQPHDDYFAAQERFTPDAFRGKRFAVIGLGDATFAHFCGAVDFLQDWIQQMNGQLVMESLRVDGYYFDQDKNTELIKDWAHTLSKTLQPS